MFQELPVKFCAGATFITGFNGSGYSDCTFLPLLPVRPEWRRK
ncbi:hypothetical protein ECDEC12B_1601 [Escherichia coli DEC12B]|nr:hypothetical protein ECDEC12B_1601 [Escherichia coli DEC12B]